MAVYTDIWLRPISALEFVTSTQLGTSLRRTPVNISTWVSCLLLQMDWFYSITVDSVRVEMWDRCVVKTAYLYLSTGSFVSMAIFQLNLGYVFFLHLIWKRIFVQKWHWLLTGWLSLLPNQQCWSYDWLIDWVRFNLPHYTHYRSYTGQMTQPTVSKHWRK